MFGKQAKKGIDGWYIVIAVLVLYIFNVGGLATQVNKLTGTQASAAAPVGTTVVSPAGVTTCPIEDTTLTLDSFDAYTKNTEISNIFHRVWVNGKDQGRYAEGATVTVSPGDTVTAIFGENLTASSGYYAVKKDLTIPCKGTANLEAGLAPFETSPTITLFNENGQVMAIPATNAQAMDASSTYNIPIKVAVTSKTSFGNPDHPGNGNVMCVYYLSSKFTSIKLDGASAAPTPRSANQTATGKVYSCYYIPVISNSPDDQTDGEWKGTLNVKTSATGIGSDVGNATIFVRDVSVDLDANSLAWINDLQDEDQNDLGDQTDENNVTIVVS